jgi:hypothetical protein
VTTTASSNGEGKNALRGMAVVVLGDERSPIRLSDPHFLSSLTRISLWNSFSFRQSGIALRNERNPRARRLQQSLELKNGFLVKTPRDRRFGDRADLEAHTAQTQPEPAKALASPQQQRLQVGATTDEMS